MHKTFVYLKKKKHWLVNGSYFCLFSSNKLGNCGAIFFWLEPKELKPFEVMSKMV